MNGRKFWLPAFTFPFHTLFSKTFVHRLFNSLTNNKILDITKFKAFADKNLNNFSSIEFENTVGKGENAGYQHCLLFPRFLLQFRQKSGLRGKVLKIGLFLGPSLWTIIDEVHQMKLHAKLRRPTPYLSQPKDSLGFQCITHYQMTKF